VHIAFVDDFKQREAGMLFVVGTQAAIVRATLVDFGLEGLRHIARFQVFLAAFVIVNVGGNQRLLHPVFRAAFLVIDIAVLKQDFGWHDREAFLTQ
jgi:hypothetical protein